MVVKYFFDSYAVIEIIKGSLNYVRFLKEEIALTVFNLTEIYYSALNDLGEKEAEEIYIKYKECVAEIDDETIKEAMKFRKKNKSKNLSYADCIGYVYALRNKLIFLTGDKEFKDLNNVEFVK